jgi:hypothetical protein
MNEIVQKYTNYVLGNVGKSLPKWNMLWLKLVGEFWQRFPLLLVSFCRNQQAKLAGNAEKQQQMLQKIFCLTTENFPTKICKKSM